MNSDPQPEEDGRPAEARRSRAPVVVAAAGGLMAAGIGAAVALGVFRQDPADDTPPPAVEGGLKVELEGARDGDRIDPARPLRCFVEGRFVGELIVADCAKRNGVAAQALDVGLDEQGELAAVVGVPEPAMDVFGADAPVPEPDPVAQAYVPPPTPTSGPVGECMRHAGGEWRNLGDALQLDTCVQVLFAGRCEEPGSASYGRWKGQTLRLVTGRVEIAPDGANFSTLAEQDASCMLP
jgi:hypothetical protein